MSDQQEFWDERYRGEELAFGDKPNVFLTQMAHDIPSGGRVLVPGDGQGRNGLWLAAQGFNVETLDISPLAVATAQKLAASLRVSIRAEVADLLKWSSPPQTYDAIVSLYVHFNDEDRPRVHKAMVSALKPGGMLLLESFSLDQLNRQRDGTRGGPKTASMLFSKHKLAEDFVDARLLLLEEAEIILQEGYRHVGLSSVVRAVVQKQ